MKDKISKLATNIIIFYIPKYTQNDFSCKFYLHQVQKGNIDVVMYRSYQSGNDTG